MNENEILGALIGAAAKGSPELKVGIIKAISEDLKEDCDLMGVSIGEVSDGYHTFDELYGHRIACYKALCKVKHDDFLSDFSTKMVWKSLIHSDSTSIDGWFIAGIGTLAGEQITYHIPQKEYDSWPALELLIAPEFDGHTSADVLKRLAEL